MCFDLPLLLHYTNQSPHSPLPFLLNPQFSSWVVTTKWEFALSWIAVAFFAVIYHAMRFLIYTLEDYMHRPYVEGDESRNVSSSGSTSDGEAPRYQQLGSKSGETDMENNTAGSSTRSGMKTIEASSPTQYILLRVLHSVLSGVNYGVALLLMLVAMTFNPSLLVALMFGYAVGDFMFFSLTRPASMAQDCH